MVFNRHRILIDVRESAAFARRHLPEACNLPYQSIGQWKHQLDRNAEYILICEHGGAAIQAARELECLGIRAAAVVGGYSYLSDD